MKALNALPLLIFIALIVAFASLLLNPRTIETIDKPLPAFAIDGLSDEDLQNQTALVNFFASWCVPCRAEHALLLDIKNIPVYGIAYKDKKSGLENYLHELGNPYRKIGYDHKGTAFIDWGLSGVPETFIIHQGKLRYHHTGALEADDINEIIMPLITQLVSE